MPSHPPSVIQLSIGDFLADSLQSASKAAPNHPDVRVQLGKMRGLSLQNLLLGRVPKTDAPRAENYGRLTEGDHTNLSPAASVRRSRFSEF